jgi:bifunctional DNA-binding transcriptional regulator/antitoxin component of YhaV-PrlF toxin-antitoxin module
VAVKTFYDGRFLMFVVLTVESGVELKKVDEQGRFILPADWRETELSESREIYVIKRKGYLKIVPRRRIDLTECFDKVDLGIESIGNWGEFEKKFYGEHP